MIQIVKTMSYKDKEKKSEVFYVECPYCNERIRFTVKGDSCNCPNCGTKVNS